MNNTKRNLLIIVAVAVVIVCCVRINININTKDNYSDTTDVESDVEVLKSYYSELEKAHEEGNDISVSLSSSVLSISSNGIKHLDGTTTMLKAGEYAYYEADNELGFYILYTCNKKHSGHEYKIGE